METGAGIHTASNYDKEEVYYEGVGVSVEEELSVASINVPLNLAYQCSLSDKITFTPYAGIKVKGFVFGEYTVTAKALGETEKETVDLFDEDDMDDSPCKSFIIGWQIGATFTYNRFNLGVSYGADFTEFNTDTRFKTTAVTLGVNF